MVVPVSEPGGPPKLGSAYLLVNPRSAAEAVVVQVQPDLVLMDLSMPVTDGIAATRAVLAARPATKVVVLTSYADAARLHEALDAGAVGYLLEDAEPDEILRALRDAAAGGVPLSPRAAAGLLPGNRPAGPATTAALTSPGCSPCSVSATAPARRWAQRHGAA